MSIQNSIVIVNCNGGESLQAALTALKLQEAVTTEVIVVDNASFDDPTELVKRQFPQVRLIRLESNRGYAAAANRGMHESRGQVVVFCHADVMASVHGLTELADHVREGAGRRVVGVAPRVVGRDGVEQPTVGRLPTLARGAMGVLNPPAARRVYRSSLDHLADHEWVAMPCIAFDCDVLARLGGFDKQFFCYYHDADLCARLHERSHRILFRRDVTVIHTGGAPGDAVPDHLARLMRKDQQRYFRKHRPAWEGNFLDLQANILRKAV